MNGNIEVCSLHKGQRLLYLQDNRVPLCTECITFLTPSQQSSLIHLPEASKRELTSINSLLTSIVRLRNKSTPYLLSTIKQLVDNISSLAEEESVQQAIVKSILEYLKQDTEKLRTVINNLMTILQGDDFFKDTHQKLIALSEEMRCNYEMERYLSVMENSRTLSKLKNIYEEVEKKIEFITNLSNEQVPSISLLGVNLSDLNLIYNSILEPHIASLLHKKIIKKGKAKGEKLKEEKKKAMKDKVKGNFCVPDVKVQPYDEKTLINLKSSFEELPLKGKKRRRIESTLNLDKLIEIAPTIKFSFNGVKNKTTMNKDKDLANKLTKIMQSPDNHEMKYSSICNLLKARSDIYKLELSEIEINESNYSTLLTLIKSIEKVPKLKFRKTFIDKEPMLKLLNNLDNFKEFDVLSFKQMNLFINEPIIDQFIRAKDLNFSCCKLDFIEKANFSLILEKTKSISKLKIKKCGIDDKMIDEMQDSLRMNKTVNILHLDNNNITIEGLTNILLSCKDNLEGTK